MRQNLPVPLTPLIGRDDELAKLEALLRGTSPRLMTITGAGGIGKTRLALELAHRLQRRAASRCSWVSLASVEDARDVPAALASTLDVQIPAGQSAQTALSEALAHRDAVIFIDNFEHVSDAAPLVADLLQAGSSLRIVATSRSLLNISGEHRVALGPLALPDDHADVSAVSELDGFSAVRLFVERADAATGSFSLTPENAADVVAICRALDGLPLAIELAAARLRHRPLTAIASRSNDHLQLLVGGPRDQPARHQTIHEAIDWSYRLLTPRTQEIFRRIAALPGGCTLETARMTGLPPDQTEPETLELLTMLVDCSLARWQADAGGEPRYSMLETIRQFGLWQLQAEGEHDETMRALGTGLIHLADRGRKALGGAQQRPWIDRLHAERGNVRSVCEWAIQANEPDIVLRLCSLLWYFWVQSGNLGEGRDLLRRALALPGPMDASLRASAVYNLGNLAFELHDYDDARRAFNESLALWERTAYRDGVASAHNGLGLIEREIGAYEAAADHFRTASDIWQALQDEPGVAITFLNLGSVALAAGDARTAMTHLTSALAIQRRLDDVDGLAYTTWRLGQAACLDDRLDDAQALFRESQQVFTRIGDRRGEASVLHAMAYRALLAGDEKEALRGYHDALSLRHALAERDGIIECVEGIAAIAASRGDAVAAARLLSATEAYRARIGAVPPFSERRQIEQAWAGVRGRLTMPALDEARWRGVEMSLDETALEALRLLKRPTDVAPAGALEQLSARERDVYALLSEYLTDREIAERLFLSHRTVERHVGSILDKLGVKNRREAAALGALRRAS